MAGWHGFAVRIPPSRVRWRSGRPFKAARFVDTWEGFFHDLPEAQQPPAPLPMMYAATVVTQMFVQGSRETRDLRFFSPDPTLYRFWWETQRKALAGGDSLMCFGGRRGCPGSCRRHLSSGRSSFALRDEFRTCCVKRESGRGLRHSPATLVLTQVDGPAVPPPGRVVTMALPHARHGSRCKRSMNARRI